MLRTIGLVKIFYKAYCFSTAHKLQGVYEVTINTFNLTEENYMRKFNVLDKIVYSNNYLAGLAALGYAKQDEEIGKQMIDEVYKDMIERMDTSDFMEWFRNQCLVVQLCAIPAGMIHIIHNLNEIINEIGEVVINLKEQQLWEK